MLPLVDIVILNYNGRKFLDGCLRTVLDSTYPNKQVYLLDNASTADDVSYVRVNYPNVKLILNPNNNGYCAAYNLAFEQCIGDYIICLNNDVEVAPDWIESMVALAESDPKIAAVQPKLVSFFDRSLFEYAGASGGMMDVFGYPFLRGRLFKTVEQDNGQYNDVTQVFWTSGAAMFLRKSALQISGVLDETIVHHMDEIDLCWRLRMAGFKCMVEPKSVIRHIGGATIQTASFKKIYWNHRNAIYIMIKNFDSGNAWIYVPAHVVLDWVAMAQAAAQFDWTMVKGIIAAHWWLLTHLPLMLRKRKETQARRRVGDVQVLPFMYQGSVVLEYFLKGRKTYSSLKNIQAYENISHP